MSPQAGCILLEQVAPRLRALSFHLPQVGCDDHEELFQDGLAIAAQMLESAEVAGKEVTAGNIAYYASKQLAVGRRSTYGGRADALSCACQLDGHSEVIPLSLWEEPASDTFQNSEPEHGSLMISDLLVAETEDPAQAAARNLDWEAFLEEHDPLLRRVVETLASGGTMHELKAETGWSDSTLSSRKRALAALLQEDLGPDCLADAGRDPLWINDLRAGWEKEVGRRDRGLGIGNWV